MIRLGLLLVFLTLSVATRAADAGGSSRIELLSRSAFKIELPTGWRVEGVIDWEDEVYYIYDASGKILLIDFGNNPDFIGLRRNNEEVQTMLNGEKAMEFRKDGLLSDVIIEARCGEARYAWLHRIAKDSIVAERVTAAMRSIACVNPRTNLPTSASSAPHNAAEFFRIREQVAYFEVFHADGRELYHPVISLESLLAAKTEDYVRIDSGNSDAVADLYQALANTVTDLKAECQSDRVDVRWAIVMNYRDGKKKEAIGFGPRYSCVRILSRKAPVVASDALLKYVKRNFPFMH